MPCSRGVPAPGGSAPQGVCSGGCLLRRGGACSWGREEGGVETSRKQMATDRAKSDIVPKAT